MNPAVQRYLEAASGWTQLTAAKAERVVKQLVRSGEVAGDQVGDLVEELLERQRKNRDALSSLIKAESTRAVRAMGMATSSEVERLQKQVADLKRELRAAQAGRTTGTAKKATAKKATAKKATAKKATAKKATAKKATARRSPAKKATAKKATARRSPAKKATAKKATARKATS